MSQMIFTRNRPVCVSSLIQWLAHSLAPCGGVLYIDATYIYMSVNLHRYANAAQKYIDINTSCLLPFLLLSLLRLHYSFMFCLHWNEWILNDSKKKKKQQQLPHSLKRQRIKNEHTKHGYIEIIIIRNHTNICAMSTFFFSTFFFSHHFIQWLCFAWYEDVCLVAVAYS